MKLDHKKMLSDINKILEKNHSFLFEMECKAGLPNQKDFTQEEAKQMEEILGQIYLIAHGTTCKTCGTKYLLNNTTL